MTRPLQTGERGVASLKFKDKTFWFRTNPNSIRWKYNMNTKTENTYGGRVIQLLSVNIGDMAVIAEAGAGGVEEMERVNNFMRDMMIEQRDGTTATFEYTTRGWKMNVYIINVPFQDQWNAVTREFTLQFKVQEDVSGVVTSNLLSYELARLQDGIGFKKGPYNQPAGTYRDSEQGWMGMGEQIPDQIAAFGDTVDDILSGLYPGVEANQRPQTPQDVLNSIANGAPAGTGGGQQSPSVPFPIPQPNANRTYSGGGGTF